MKLRQDWSRSRGPWPSAAPLTLWLGAACLSVAGLGTSCGTLSQDLERARRHYAAHEFAASLAVLRLVGEEEAWLAADEQVEYAAMRGLTDLRLAGTVSEGPERRALVECGREWLEVAQRREAAHPGALSADMSLRIRDTLAGLIGLGPTTGECVEPTP